MPGKMRATRKAIFPALLSLAHRYKRTENREAQHPKILQTLGTEDKAADSALLRGVWLPKLSALCMLNRAVREGKGRVREACWGKNRSITKQQQ